MKSYWSRVGPSFKMTGVFIKKRERNWDTAIYTRRAPEDEGRDRMVIPHTNNCQQTNQREGRGAEQGSQFSEPVLPTLIMDSGLQNQCEINFCCAIQPVCSLYYSSPRKQQGQHEGIRWGDELFCDSRWQSNHYLYLSKLKSVHQKDCVYST